VTIAQGGTVSFGYPSGANLHNVRFTSTAQPASCEQTAGTLNGSVPPLPHTVAGPGWRGSCTFSAPGTYTFVCDRHPRMTGAVEVVEASSETPPAGSPSPSPSPGYAPAPVGSESEVPAAGRAARGLKVTGRVRDGRLRGSVVVARSPSTLRVELFARVGGARLTRVGALRKNHVGAGRRTFAVRLTGRAAKALARRGHLAVKVRVRVTPPEGRAATLRTSVTVAWAAYIAVKSPRRGRGRRTARIEGDERLRRRVTRGAAGRVCRPVRRSTRPEPRQGRPAASFVRAVGVRGAGRLYRVYRGQVAPQPARRV
jgi:hypothetical protein